MEELYINVSFDDFCPRSGFGLPGDPSVKLLLGLREEFPEIKYTFFTVPKAEFEIEPRWKVVVKRRLHWLGLINKLTSFKISSEDWLITKHQEWLKFVKDNVEKKIFEIGQHGYNHYAPFFTPSAEFSGLTETETEKTVRDGKNVLAVLSVVNSFRSPAWGLNNHLEKVLCNQGFKYLSLDAKLSTLKFDGKVFFIPQQYSIDSNVLKEDLVGKNYLFIKGHLPPQLENGVTEENVNNLCKVLRELNKKFFVRFIFLDDIKSLYEAGKLRGVEIL